MRHPLPLFDEVGPTSGPTSGPISGPISGPASEPASGAAALRLAAQAPVLLSADARAFDLQLRRVAKLKSQLQELDALEQSHRQTAHQQLTPLQARHRLCMREMAVLIDQRMDSKALTASQRQTAAQMLCSLAGALAEHGDADMAALHDKRSPQSLDELKQADAARLRAQIEELLGEPLEAAQEDASLEEMLAAGMARVRQSLEAKEEARRAAAARRKARQKPHAAPAQIQEGETHLRRLFRQLASSLHPDREPDAHARLAKTALMSEVNAAYGRRDGVALLQIHQEVLSTDPQAAALVSQEKLAGWTVLIKQQVADLERERAARSRRLAAEFELDPGLKLTAAALQSVLKERANDLEEEIALMQRDLQLVQNDAGLKRLLNQQAQASRRPMRAAARVGFA